MMSLDKFREVDGSSCGGCEVPSRVGWFGRSLATRGLCRDVLLSALASLSLPLGCFAPDEVEPPSDAMATTSEGEAVLPNAEVTGAEEPGEVSSTTDPIEEATGSAEQTTGSVGGTTGSVEETTFSIDPTTGGGLDEGGDSEASQSSGDDTSEGECGDGIVQETTEECDDGELNSETGRCLPETCRVNVCRDGYVNMSQEECDDGNAINSDTCSNECTIPRCGDLIIQEGRDETCDQGAGNALADGGCHPVDCVFIVCGDGVTTRPVESCDDGNNVDNDACRNDCINADCGDRITQRDRGEECDDGNVDDTDSCSAACLNTFCGDGIRQSVRGEACDDGDQDNFDDCPNDCQLALCGDGTTEGREECDDGNRVDTDSCTNVCRDAECGDGITSGTEECDNGDSNSNRGSCLDDCRRATCGDGFTLDGAEECDDGGLIDYDGCSSTCDEESRCFNFNTSSGLRYCVETTATDQDIATVACELTGNTCRSYVVSGECASGSVAAMTNAPSGYTLATAASTFNACHSVFVYGPGSATCNAYNPSPSPVPPFTLDLGDLRSYCPTVSWGSSSTSSYR